jgi:hypothetical protein
MVSKTSVFFFLFLSFISRLCFSQSDTIRNGNVLFLYEYAVSKNESGFQDSILSVSLLTNSKPMLIKKFFIHSSVSDCNNTYTDKGAVYFSGDSLIFETRFYQKTGLDPINQAEREIFIIDRVRTRVSGTYLMTLPHGSHSWIVRSNQ